MRTQLLNTKYAFSPSLLDAYQRMIDTSVEGYFYQDETGAWHANYSESDGTLHFSEEEVDARLKQEFLDYVNKVPTPASESACKGSCLNEIVDCMVLGRKSILPQYTIKTVRNGSDLFAARVRAGIVNEDSSQADADAAFASVGQVFFYAALDGFEFFFDKEFCLEVADFFSGSLCQFYTKANIETSRGIVELHGFVDYIRQMKVMDLKTTKRYTFGDFKKKWQRYTYPFTLVESGLMKDVQEFEFVVYVLKGGTGRTPLITGAQYREAYTYDHEQARTMLAQQCECVADFLEENRTLITNQKVFANNVVSDYR